MRVVAYASIILVNCKQSLNYLCSKLYHYPVWICYDSFVHKVTNYA